MQKWLKILLLILLIKAELVFGASASLSVNEDTELQIFPPNYGVSYSDTNTSVSDASHGTTRVDTNINKIRYNPNSNYCGSDSFTITTATVGEPDSSRRPSVVIETLNVSVTVNCVNDTPTISNISNLTITEDAAQQSASFTVNDVETSAGSLSLSKTSSNTSLIPTGNISFGGSGSNRVVYFKPATNKYGTATLTVTVSDGNQSRSDSFVVTVNAINDAPTISNISNRTINEDAAQQSASFTVNDVETSAGSLTLSKASSNTSLIPTGNISFGGSGSNRVVYFTPAANQYGTATLTVTVSDGNQSRSDSFVVTVNAVNDAPTISNISNRTINEDAAQQSASFTVNDVETSAGSLSLSKTSSNASLIPTGNISFGGSGSNRVVYFTPAANQYGTATLTVTVSDGNQSRSDSFVVTVNSVNDTPTISNISDRTINEDAAQQSASFTVSDVETSAGSLSLSKTSSNTSLIPTGNISFGGSGSNRVVYFKPAADKYGTATLTVTVSDGNQSRSDSFLVTVNAVNDTPTISNISDRTINEDAAQQSASFTVGDVETSAGALTLSKASSNTSLIPTGNINFGGSGSNRVVYFTPAANQYGTATLTVTVSDGNQSRSDSFVVTVNSVNDTPTISNISNRTINEDAAQQSASFTVGDVETSAGSLSLSKTSSNTSLIPTGNISFGGSGSNRVVYFTPAANQYGSATLTVTVSDGNQSRSDSFVVTVNSVNDTPTISNISNRTINEDAAQQSASFTVSDVETSAGSLSLSKTSSNTSLIPTGNISFGGSGSNRMVNFTPAANQYGTATLTVTVSDGNKSRSESFIVMVNPVNDAPTLSSIADFTIAPGETLGPINFSVSDPDTASGVLEVTSSSSNQSVISNDSISLSGSSENRSLVINSIFESKGSAEITLSVSDGELSQSKTFNVSVAGAPIFASAFSGQTPDATLVSLNVPDSENVGEINGQAGISGGASTYNIPIAIPPGRTGVQPNVSINYSSRSGTGLVGAGWNLSASSSIARCGKIYTLDSVSSRVQHNSDDRLCLDGERLKLSSSGSYWSYGATYHPETNPNIRVNYLSGGYFMVEYTDGTRQYYGKTAQARLTRSGTNVVSSWMIEQHLDSSENAIHYYYSDEGDAGQLYLSEIRYTGLLDTAGDRKVNFNYVNRADISAGYLANSYQFTGKRLKSITTEISGQDVSEYRLVYRDEIDAIDNTLALTTDEWSGSSAQSGADNEPQTAARKSLLDSIEYCSWDKNSSKQCLPKTFFDYELWKAGFHAETKLFDVARDMWLGDSIITGDFDGDAKLDYGYTYSGLGISGIGMSVRLSSMQSSAEWIDISELDGYLGTDSSSGMNLTLDYDLDGVTDFISAWKDEDGEVRMAFVRWNSARSAFDVHKTDISADCSKDSASQEGWQESHCKSHVVDINNDGKMDIVAAKRQGTTSLKWTIYINQSDASDHLPHFVQHGTATTVADYSKVAPEPYVLTDFDGDGRLEFIGARLRGHSSNDSKDAIRFDFVKNNGIWSLQETLLGSSDDTTPYPIAVARGKLNDFNGDGLLDVVVDQGIGGINTTYYNRGGVLVASSDDIDYGEFTFDYNNDGLVDYLKKVGKVYNHDCGEYPTDDAKIPFFEQCEKSNTLWSWRVLQTQLDENGVASLIEIPTQELNVIAAENSITFADHDGDGATDIIVRKGLSKMTSGHASGYYVYRNPNAKADKLTKVISGYSASNKTSEFTYSSLGNLATQNRYSYEQEQNFPYVKFTTATQMVDQFKSSNGIGGKNIVEYAYEDARYHLQGRGFQGFRVINSTDLSTGTINQSTFNQSFPFSGKVVATSSSSLRANGQRQVVATSSNAWASKQVRNAHLVYQGSSLASQYALNTGEKLSEKSSEVITIDDYGNVGHIESEVFNGYSRVKSTTHSDYYAADETNWWLNKLEEKRVTTETLSNTSGVYNASLDQSKSTTTRIESYDPKGSRKPSSIKTTPVDAKPVTVSTVYNDYGLATQVTTSSSGETSRVVKTGHSSDGYFVEWVDSGLGKTYSYANPIHGQPDSTEDINGLVSNIEYDAFGRAEKITPPTGTGQPVYTRLAWCSQDCDGHGFANDVASRIVSKQTSYSVGTPKSTVYKDKLNRAVATATRAFDGSRYVYTTVVFDALGRKVRETSPSYNASNENGVHFVAYDNLDRLTEKRIDQANGQSLTVTYVYSGHLTDINAGGLFMSRIYTGNGQLLQTTDANQTNGPGVTQYAYDAMGNPIVLQDANGNSITAKYNSLGQKLWVDDPNMGYKSFTYTGFGEVQSETDANNDTYTYKYDSQGRLYERHLNSSKEAEFSFDTAAQGNTGSVCKGLPAGEASTNGNSFSRSYGYDQYCRLVQSTTTIDGESFVQGTQYDGNYGRVKAVSYPTGLTLENWYNSDGYLTHQVNAASDYVYHEVTDVDARGQVLEALKANGVLTEGRRYDEVSGQMTEVFTHSTIGTNQRHRIAYTDYDQFGNLKEQVVETRQTNGSIVTTTENYGYDNLHRLIWSSVHGARIDYNYDKVGNLTLKDDYASSFSYGNLTKSTRNAGPNAVHQITKAGGGTVTFTYDNNGNRTHENGVERIRYNAFNKPTWINKGGVVSNFYYGADQMRYKQVKTGKSGGTETTIYIGKAYEEIRYDGKTIKKSYLGDTIITEKVESGASTFEAGFVHRDRLNSVVTITDVFGNVIDNKSFDPFGKPRKADMTQATETRLDRVAFDQGFLSSIESTDLTTRRGFTDHEHLDEAELIHMNGRVYDYNLGRFLSVDPFIQEPGNSQSMNPYSYIMNNPMAGNDPSGYTAEKETWDISEFKSIAVFEGGKAHVEMKNGETVTVQMSNVTTVSKGKGQVAGSNINTTDVTTVKTFTVNSGQKNNSGSNVASVGSTPNVADVSGSPSQGSGGNSELADSGSNRLKEIYEVLENATIELGGQLTEMAENIDKTSPEFVEGMADGVASVPRGISRSYIITADMLGLNGEENQKLFEMRTFAFDYVSNEVLREIYHSDEPTSKTLDFVYKHHKQLTSALGKAPIEKRAYILGRFVGRAGVLSKMKSTPAWGVKLGDFYWGVVRSNIGPARVVEQHLFGDTIENMGVDLRGR